MTYLLSLDHSPLIYYKHVDYIDNKYIIIIIIINNNYYTIYNYNNNNILDLDQNNYQPCTLNSAEIQIYNKLSVQLLLIK